MVLDKTSIDNHPFEGGGNYRIFYHESDPLIELVNIIWRFLSVAVDEPVSSLLIHNSQSKDANLFTPTVERVAQNNLCSESKITLSTSGTTGKPKIIEKSIAEAFEKKQPGKADEIWLLTFAPFRWAGLSVMVHVLKSNCHLVVPNSLSPEDLLKAALEQKVSHISLTPSYFRKLQLSLGNDKLGLLMLKQVTFGGEVASQSVLDNAKGIWPEARISHVYASTEFGDICSVSDGYVGIPKLKFSSKRFEFSEDGELFIDEKPTGDYWEDRNGRYHFLGRREEIINVGGLKVSPIEVESVAIGLNGVVQARAYPIKSPILGEVVGLEYEGSVSELELKNFLRSKLPKIAWPVTVKQVEHIRITAAGKIDRIADKQGELDNGI